jgi:hypothetical protein
MHGAVMTLSVFVNGLQILGPGHHPKKPTHSPPTPMRSPGNVTPLIFQKRNWTRWRIAPLASFGLRHVYITQVSLNLC